MRPAFSLMCALMLVLPLGSIQALAQQSPQAQPLGQEAAEAAAASSRGAQEQDQAAENAPPASTVPQEAKLRWLATEPAAGQQVRLRLRDAALQAVLDPATRWELVAISPGQAPQPLAADLRLPPGGEAWPVYSVPAALGPARSPPDSQDTLWPLLLPGARLPLAKLKVVAAPPAKGDGFARAVDIVQLDQAGEPLGSAASGVVSPPGLAGAGPNWFSVRADAQALGWAVVVHDGLGREASAGSTPGLLQLSKIDAYVAEVMLSTVMPAGAELRLRCYPADAPAAPAASASAEASSAATADPDSAPLSGEFSRLEPLVADPSLRSNRAEPGRLRDRLGEAPGWFPALGMAIAGCGLLVFGLRLLRRPAEEA